MPVRIIHIIIRYLKVFILERYFIALLILLIPPIFGYVVWIRFTNMKIEYRELHALNMSLVKQMDNSKANQETMLQALQDLAQNEERFLALLERIVNLEQHNQTFAQQQLAALAHMARTQEVNAYILSTPQDKRPQLMVPPSFNRWLQDTHDKAE